MNHQTKLVNLQPFLLGVPPKATSPPTDGAYAVAIKEDDRATHSGTSTIVEELLQIHEYERQRMGQELHDSAGQLLVSLQLSIARLKITEADCGHRALIDEIQDTVRQIDREIRALAFLHYPAELGDRALGEAVRTLVHGFGRRTGIRISFRSLGDQTAVAEPISVTMLRVAQEALVNVHRHSHASSAKVLLETSDKRVHLTVSDDGVGIPTTVDVGKECGIGLQGMRHRVEMHGGHFGIRNLKHGTKISATVPL